jgi:hypothetical protein
MLRYVTCYITLSYVTLGYVCVMLSCTKWPELRTATLAERQV